jgi:cell wall-associated NlpC family hydrolase
MRYKKYACHAVALVSILAGCGGSDVEIINKNRTASVVQGALETKPQSSEVAPTVSLVSRAEGVKNSDQDEAIKSGPLQYFIRITGLGLDGDMHMTYVNGSSLLNFMTWRSGMTPGRCSIAAFIPRNYATTRSARYRIGSWIGGTFQQIAEVRINQYAISDAFVNLGTFTFAGEPAVRLGDDTGEAYSTKRMVGFDVIRFTGLDQTSTKDAAAYAIDKLDAPYVWGAKGPDRFDCSGLTKWAYTQTGKTIPDGTGGQSGYGSEVSRASLQRGDLVFFATDDANPGQITHVGIYLDGTRFINANSYAGKVVIDDLSSTYWNPRYKTAHRMP